VCAIICIYLCAKAKPSSHESRVGQKVGKRSTKPPGFTKPHYFYIYNISLYDFTAIQTARAEIYLFTMGTPYKIYSRILVLASYGGGKLIVKCPSPETLRNEVKRPMPAPSAGLWEAHSQLASEYPVCSLANAETVFLLEKSVVMGKV
jgi:hypothetical protein